MNSELINWLLSGDPWVEYRTRIDLLEQSESDYQVQQAYEATLANSRIQNLITELSEWPGSILKSHKKAGHLLHKLVFLADIGLRADNPDIRKIVQEIEKHKSPEGLFQVLVNINPRYGGKGEDQFVWMLCDAPLLMYAQVRFSIDRRHAIQDGLAYLVELERENGWPCAVSPEIGKFRGPGRKADPCPYANLLMLRLLAEYPEKHSDPAVKIGVETLLSLWEERKTIRPYLFAMGTDFAKLKAPLIWYDILHTTDVLVRFRWALGDKRLQEMIEIVRNKADESGKFTGESVWRDWKVWEFGQKKEPSRWITLIAQRILKRSTMT